MKIEPLPCPFCGAMPTILFWHGGPKTKRVVWCESEECEVNPSVSGPTRKIAVEKWNRRTPMPQDR